MSFPSQMIIFSKRRIIYRTNFAFKNHTDNSLCSHAITLINTRKKINTRIFHRFFFHVFSFKLICKGPFKYLLSENNVSVLKFKAIEMDFRLLSPPHPVCLLYQPTEWQSQMKIHLRILSCQIYSRHPVCMENLPKSFPKQCT